VLLDMLDYVTAGGVTAFPNFPYAERPLAQDEIKETIYVIGDSLSAQVSVGADPD
jgi:hypothetical protein